MRALGIPDNAYPHEKPKIMVVTRNYTPFRMMVAFVLPAFPLAVIFLLIDRELREMSRKMNK